MLRDKRLSLRYKTLLNVEIRPNKIPSSSIPGIIKNISYDGLNLISEDFNPQLGETLELVIKHPVEDIDFHAVGEIVWNKHVNTRCYVGLRIKEMDDKLRIELLEYAFDKWN